MYYLCDSIAIAELISSFVTYCSTSFWNHVRRLTTHHSPTLMVQTAHHPVLLDLYPGVSVMNNMALDVAEALRIIQDQRKSRKSNPIRMIWLLAVTAYIECSVQAHKDTPRVVDCSFFHVTCLSDIICRKSNALDSQRIIIPQLEKQ